MKNGFDIESTIQNAKRTAEKEGYDQYILREQNGNYSFIRKFHTLTEERRKSAMFHQQVVGIVRTFWNNGIISTEYVKLQ